MTLIRQVIVKRIDWFRVLADLKRAGLSLRNIAALTGLSKTQLIGLRNEDTEPKHLAGEALVDRKELHIGTFPTRESAQATYDAKALELHGAFASPNAQITPIKGVA